MRIKLKRKKVKSFNLSLCYKLGKLYGAVFGSKRALHWFLNLEWALGRLATEASFLLYPLDDHPVRRHSVDFILSGISAQDTVVDIGCRKGQITKLLAAKCHKIIGIDHDPVAIETAKAENQKDNIDYVCQDVDAFLNTGAVSYDAMILSHIIEHLDDPEILLQACRDKFKKVYIEVPDFDSTPLNHFRKREGLSLIYSDADHIWEFDRDGLLMLLSKCGLEVVEAEFRHGVMKCWCQYARPASQSGNTAEPPGGKY